LFGSRPPAYDRLWKMADRAGFTVDVRDRNSANREKQVDTAIAHMMTKDAYTVVDIEQDTMTLVAGDGDYVPIVEDLVKGGCTFDVVFWGACVERAEERGLSIHFA